MLPVVITLIHFLAILPNTFSQRPISWSPVPGHADPLIQIESIHSNEKWFPDDDDHLQHYHQVHQLVIRDQDELQDQIDSRYSDDLLTSGVHEITRSYEKQSASVAPELLDVDVRGKYNYEVEYRDWEHVYSRYLPRNGQCRVSSGDLQEAAVYANERIKAYESDIVRYLLSDPRGLNFSSVLAEAALQSKFNEFATEFLSQQRCRRSRRAIAMDLSSIPVPTSNTPSGEFCLADHEKDPDLQCTDSKYRRLDGRCNNLQKPNWGAQFQCHRRLIPPDYGDGIYTLRLASSGSPLPSARLLAEFLHPDIRDIDKKLSLMHMQWGQLIAHDLTKTIQNLGLAINCCPRPGRPNIFHPECWPITDFPQDRFTAQFNQSCINFIRTIACNTCQLGPRDQINAATPLLDVSNLYAGNLPKEMAGTVRTFRAGQLRESQDLTGRPIMTPRQGTREQDPIDLTTCNQISPQFPCFHSGDGQRVNQHPGINAIQTIILRRHNQHAEGLAKVNPHWDDETLFQEARRILIAELNRIHFGEYLPAILGQSLMGYFQLDLTNDGFTAYDPKVDPSTLQAFIVGANRFGHSQTPSIFNVISRAFQESYQYMLRDKFFEMSDIWMGSIPGIIQGLLEDPSLATDPFLVTDLKQFLFARPNRTGVLDLVAIDIQRGRDHGVPGYVHFVNYCTGIELKQWSDLHQLIPAPQVAKMSLVYENIQDIDLVVGGIAEKHLPGAVLGPTFGCLTGIQFYHLKYGDRFYFEHGNQPGSFTLKQLNNIRAVSSLANLLCKTVEIKKVQQLALLRPSKSNPRTACYTFTDIDYELWRKEETEEAFYYHGSR